MPKAKRPDTTRAAVIARAAQLDLNPLAIAKATDGAVSDDAVRRYLQGTADLTTAKADAVCRVLGLSPPQVHD